MLKIHLTDAHGGKGWIGNGKGDIVGLINDDWTIFGPDGETFDDIRESYAPTPGQKRAMDPVDMEADPE